jgi:predicted dehydrogenase
MGANDRLRVGLIGCGGRGTLDARNMRGLPEDLAGSVDPRLKEPRNVDIAALCKFG